MELLSEERFYQKLGLAIKEARAAKGISQSELGHILNLSRASVVNIESGRQRPSIYFLSLIAQHLEVGLKDLIPGSSDRLMNLLYTEASRRGLDESSKEKLSQFLLKSREETNQ